MKGIEILLKIITIYDNNGSNNQFESDWGYGCVVDHPRARILFDTGAKPEILEANLKMAAIDPQSIDTIIVSHKHWDHQGGVLWLAQQNSNVKIYVPKTWSKSLETKISKLEININAVKNDLSIVEDFHLIVSKNFWIRELTLVIKTSHGAIVLTGCSHTGIQHIVQKVQDVTRLNIYALFGGFHLFRSSEQRILRTVEDLKNMNIKAIAPCHCTGEQAIKILKKEFAENLLHNSVGAEFIFAL